MTRGGVNGIIKEGEVKKMPSRALIGCGDLNFGGSCGELCKLS
jgi:hypothetical protein